MASKKIITAFLLLQIGFSQEINLNNDSNDPELSPILKTLILLVSTMIFIGKANMFTGKTQVSFFLIVC